MSFIIIALISGIGLSVSLGSIGNLVLWRRMSYLGDSVAHSSLLGISLSLFYPGSPEVIIIFVCFLFAILFSYLNKHQYFTRDVLLVLNTQIGLVSGIIIISLFSYSTKINTYFFGSIFNLSIKDMAYIYLIAIITIVYLIFYWDKIILITINDEIATSEGINTQRQELLFMFIISCLITFAIKFAGLLLIAAITVLPALIVNQFSNCPKKSILYSVILSMLAVTSGVIGSIFINLPAGPLISALLIIFFIISYICKKAIQLKENN